MLRGMYVKESTGYGKRSHIIHYDIKALHPAWASSGDSPGPPQAA